MSSTLGTTTTQTQPSSTMLQISTPSIAQRQYKRLSQADVEHWMKNGYVVVRNAFTEERAASWMSQLWTRLGYDPNDKATWILDRVNMPAHNWQDCKDFAPKAWDVICDLCGGEERIAEKGVLFEDNFICNLGKDEYVGRDFDPRSLDNWHVDGDFFTHFLDSPEQSLLLIPLYSNISPGGGGTVICPDGISMIANHLYNHPEGVSPRMVPAGETTTDKDLEWFIKRVQNYPREAFHEMTGNIGDVVIMHPLMLHSASRNTLRTPRIITNPAMSMKDPFCYNRADSSEHSLIELKTLAALGKPDGLKDWKITGKRQQLNPTRTRIQASMREEELQRMAGKNVGMNTNKGYDINRLEEEVK